MKIINPITTETKQVTNTAPAAMSFVSPAFSLNSEVVRSVFTSIEVFINSAEITDPMHNKMMHHSMDDSPKKIPSTITKQAIIR